MPADQIAEIPPGWKGGFAQSNPAFAYPNPDLSSLPMLDNMANIDLLERQQAARWPEFSWETVQGDPSSRCFQMFAPDISMVGYDDTGRVYSIICPQQGACSPTLGCLNVEVSVTGQRGWVDETNRRIAADMTVEGKIWFSPSAKESPTFRLFWRLFERNGMPFPIDKAHAIRIATHRQGDATQPIFPVRDGAAAGFQSPTFAQHPEAWTLANVVVEIGAIQPTGNAAVDDFNQIVLDIFNLASGNLLQLGNTLSWNVWFEPPQLVSQQAWREHAEKWRASIDADHGSPDGPGTLPRYADKTVFKPIDAVVEAEVDKLIAWLKAHLGELV